MSHLPSQPKNRKPIINVRSPTEAELQHIVEMMARNLDDMLLGDSMPNAQKIPTTIPVLDKVLPVKVWTYHRHDLSERKTGTISESCLKIGSHKFRVTAIARMDYRKVFQQPSIQDHDLIRHAFIGCPGVEFLMMTNVNGYHPIDKSDIIVYGIREDNRFRVAAWRAIMPIFERSEAIRREFKKHVS